MSGEDARAPRTRTERTAAGRELSPSRAALLDVLRAQPQPTGVPALVAATGLHVNTVREHLEALHVAGLVDRRQDRAPGRGRPGWLYEARPGTDEGHRLEHAAVAATLVAVLERTSPRPDEAARAAGVEWGRRLAREAGGPADPGPTGARRQLLALLDDMGFAPETDDAATTLRLTRCPLLEAAQQQPGVVCAVHLGIAQGVLGEYGEDASGSELLPFVEPGACLLHLRAGASGPVVLGPRSLRNTDVPH